MSPGVRCAGQDQANRRARAGPARDESRGTGAVPERDDLKQRWARNRPEMMSKVIETARQANLNAGRRKGRLSLDR